jgi:hypothetical protein
VVDDMKVEEYEEEELNPRYGQYWMKSYGPFL